MNVYTLMLHTGLFINLCFMVFTGIIYFQSVSMLATNFFFKKLSISFDITSRSWRLQCDRLMVNVLFILVFVYITCGCKWNFWFKFVIFLVIIAISHPLMLGLWEKKVFIEYNMRFLRITAIYLWYNVPVLKRPLLRTSCSCYCTKNGK